MLIFYLSFVNMTEEQLRAEIKLLEEEIALLEEGDNDLDIVRMVREQFENVDNDLLVDIINADTHTESTLERDSITADIAQRVLEENVHRFNGVTLFPVSADTHGTYLGVRFDTFNTTSKRFNPPHYVILHKRETAGKVSTSNGRWKWSVFQSTLPPGVNVGRYEQEYLFEEHDNDTDTETYQGRLVSASISVPSLNMVNKFAMRVYDELE